MNTSTDKKCKEPSFNHFTINTGHNLLQTEQYFPNDPVVYAKLRKLAQESLTPEGVEVIGNVRFWAVTENNMYRGKVAAQIGNEVIPLLITAGAKTEDAGKELWKILQNSILKRPDAVKMKNQRPQAPFVTDYLFAESFALRYLMGYLTSHELEFLGSGMSGDFCKCMGWAFLFPEVLASR